MLTYAGVRLLDPTPDLLARVRETLDPSGLEGFSPRTYPGKNLSRLGFRGGWPRGPVCPGVLRWPSGASRWALGHYLATDGQVDAVRSALAGAAQPGSGPADLVIHDGTNSVTAAMYFLPARPLSQVEGAAGLQLFTLVDVRFYWWYVALDLAVTENTTTWAQLYAVIGTALGVTITVDPVAAAYLKPPGLLAAHYEAVPLLLDAAAWSCGQRVVCDTDGTVAVRNWGTSRASLDANLALDAPTLAGGVLALTP